MKTHRGSAQDPLERAIARLIELRTGDDAQIVASQPVSGGCIHDARLVRLRDGRRFFLKVGAASVGDAFEREAEGLRALARTRTLRVPKVVGTDQNGDDGSADHRFLVLEAIETGSRPADFQSRFGRALAELHRAEPPRGDEGRWGFHHDNYIGATPQPNGWLDSWVDFWRCRRLGHMLTLARQRGLADPQLDGLADRVQRDLGSILGAETEPPSLIHGDLWGGNYMVDTAGDPVLIDPAVYVGHREADLAMTRLFGGFDASFYRAYEETWPLAPGSELRLVLYELYHMLNHLILFGRSYRGGCLARLRTLARAVG